VPPTTAPHTRVCCAKSLVTLRRVVLPTREVLNSLLRRDLGVVPFVVAGFYGQNVPYPGFGHTSGFWVSAAIMVMLSVGLYVVFRRKDWL